MKKLVVMVIVLLGIASVCFASDQMKVTVKNDSGHKVYITATEAHKIGEKWQSPVKTKFLQNELTPSTAKIGENDVAIPIGSSVDFMLDDTKMGPIDNGVWGARVYVSWDDQLKLPSNLILNPVTDKAMDGFFEITYTQSGKTCDLSNVDAFTPVRLQFEVMDNGNVAKTSTYYDTFDGIMTKLSAICTNPKAAKIYGEDGTTLVRILSSKGSGSSYWPPILDQTSLEALYSKIKNENIYEQYTDVPAKASRSLNYTCNYAAGILTCTYMTSGQSKDSGWTGAEPPKVIKCYIGTTSPAGGQLTPTVVADGTSANSWFYYDGKPGRIGDGSIDKPGAAADMACDFVNHKLLSKTVTNQNPKTYGGIIDANSDAYSRPNSDTGPRQLIVLDDLSSASSLVITILNPNFKSSLTPPKPSPVNPPAPTKGVKNPQPDNPGRLSKLGAMTIFTCSGSISFDGYNKTLKPGGGWNIMAKSSQPQPDPKNIALYQLPVMKKGNSLYTLKYHGTTYTVSVKPGDTPTASITPKLSSGVVTITKDYAMSWSFSGM